MLIWACTITRIQPFDQQFLCPLKRRCFQSKKLKIKLMKLQKDEANFADSRWFCSYFCFQSPHSRAWGWGMCSYNITLWSAGCCCVPFLTFPHYTIIPSYTIIDLLRFFRPILLFHPILLLIFVDLSTLYHYFALYYYSGLQSSIIIMNCLRSFVLSLTK